MTPERYRMTPKGDHLGMINRHRLMPLSLVMYIEYYAHIKDYPIHL